MTKALLQVTSRLGARPTALVRLAVHPPEDGSRRWDSTIAGERIGGGLSGRDGRGSGWRGLRQTPTAWATRGQPRD
jgi:hypothetical protein